MSDKMTLYVSDKDSLQKWIMQLRLDDDAAFRADKSDIHEAIIQVARENEAEVVNFLRDD